MAKYLFIILALMIPSFWKNGKKPEKNHSQEKILIKILLNENLDQPFGIPIYSEKKEFSFCIGDGDEIFENADKQYFIFSLEKDTLKFICTGEPLQIEGQFIIPDQPKVDYQTMFDPEDFSAVIQPFKYYDPMRIGEWVFESDSASYNQVYEGRFLTGFKKCNK
jgi:hypothetical protein